MLKDKRLAKDTTRRAEMIPSLFVAIRVMVVLYSTVLRASVSLSTGECSRRCRCERMTKVPEFYTEYITLIVACTYVCLRKERSPEDNVYDPSSITHSPSSVYTCNTNCYWSGDKDLEMHNNY